MLTCLLHARSFHSMKNINDNYALPNCKIDKHILYMTRTFSGCILNAFAFIVVTVQLLCIGLSIFGTSKTIPPLEFLFFINYLSFLLFFYCFHHISKSTLLSWPEYIYSNISSNRKVETSF